MKRFKLATIVLSENHINPNYAVEMIQLHNDGENPGISQIGLITPLVKYRTFVSGLTNLPEKKQREWLFGAP